MNEVLACTLSTSKALHCAVNVVRFNKLSFEQCPNVKDVIFPAISSNFLWFLKIMFINRCCSSFFALMYSVGWVALIKPCGNKQFNKLTSVFHRFGQQLLKLEE
jgi:hypothetical protein